MREPEFDDETQARIAAALAETPAETRKRPKAATTPIEQLARWRIAPLPAHGKKRRLL